MRKNVWKILLCVGVAAALLAGCGNSGTESTGDAENDKGTASDNVSASGESNKVETAFGITVDATKAFPDKYGTVLSHSVGFYDNHYYEFDGTLVDHTTGYYGPMFEMKEPKYQAEYFALYKNELTRDDFIPKLGGDWEHFDGYQTSFTLRSGKLAKRLGGMEAFLDYDGSDSTSDGRKEHVPEVTLRVSYACDAVPEDFTELAKAARELIGTELGATLIANAYAAAVEAGGEDGMGGNVQWHFSDINMVVTVGWNLEKYPKMQSGSATFWVNRGFNRYQVETWQP